MSKKRTPEEEAEIEELKSLEADIAEIQALEAQAQGGEEDGEAPEEEGLFTKGMRALDYERAVSGGPALAKALEAITGKDVYQEGDLPSAASFEKDYPSSEALLERAGLKPQNPLLSGALGLGLDIASTPSTWATGGLAAAPKVAAKLGNVGRAATNMTGLLSEYLGKKTWKSAFKALDSESIKKGEKLMPSSVLMEAGVAAPTMRGVSAKMGGVLEGLDEARQQILDAATAAGGEIDVEKATLYARKLADEYEALGLPQTEAIAKAIREEVGTFDALRRAPGVPPRVVTKEVPSVIVDQSGRPMTKTVRKEIPGVPEQPGTSPSRASDIKSFFYKAIPSTGWAPYANTPVGTELNKSLARGLKEATEDAVDMSLNPRASRMLGVPGNYGDQLRGINARMGALLGTRKKALGEVSKQEMKDLFTSVDGALFGLSSSLGNDAGSAWRTLGFKKLADVAKSPGPRSMVGKGLTRFGQSPLTSKVAGQSAWRLMGRKPTGPTLLEEEEFE